MNQALSSAGIVLAQAVITLATFAFLLRFILQAVRADFYNPITQAIVRITDPVLKPTRKLIPPISGLDVASLLITLLLQLALVFLLFYGISPVTAVVLASFRLLNQVLTFYFFTMFIVVILSWVAPGSRHPGAELVHQVTEPVLAPFRRLIPPVGGLDLSIMVAFLVLIVLRDYLLPGIAFEIGIGRSALD